MSDDSSTEECDWTAENVQKLFSQMKKCIPVDVLTISYSRGMKHVDWNKVAFPPFSAEACRQKWKQHLDKMRKVRSLSELIVEAEDALSDPFVDLKSHPDFPKKPPCPQNMFCTENWTKIKDQHLDLGKSNHLVGTMSKIYRDLPEGKKGKYLQSYQLAYQEYKEKKKDFRQKLTVRLSKRKPKAVVTNGEDGLPPKPPANGYSLFCKEHPPTQPGLPSGSTVKNWAQGWRDLTKKEKDEYNIRVNKMKIEYTVKLHEHIENLEDKEKERIIASNAMYICKEVLLGGMPEEPDILPQRRKRIRLNKAERKQILWTPTQNNGRTSNVSDSEDGDLEDGTSEEEEEEGFPDWNEEVDEREEDSNITFDMY